MRVRLNKMVPLLISVVLGPAVSFESRAQRMPVILEQLTPVVGQKLEADGNFRNEVLILRADRTPVQELLDRIAQVAVGKWEKKDETLTLRPDMERRKQQEAARMAEREKACQAILDQLQRELEGPYDRDLLLESARLIKGEDRNAGFRARRRSPRNRLVMRSLIAIGAPRLARIEKGDQLIVSTSPAGRQQAIPDSERIRRLFDAENKVLEETLPALPPGFSLDFPSGGQPRPNASGKTNDFESILIKIPEILNFGATVRYRETKTQFVQGYFMVLGAASAVPADTPPKESLDALQVDPITRAFRSLLDATKDIPHPTADPDSEIGQVISDPLHHEPLAIGSEIYIDFAKQKGLNLAVLLNDGALGRFGSGEETRRSFELLTRRSMKWEERDGWLCLTSITPVESRAQRDDRAAMKTFMTAKSELLRNQGLYLAGRPFSYPTGIGARLRPLFAPNEHSFDLETREDERRLYGMLSVAQVRAGAVQVRKLSTQARQVLLRLVDSPSAGFRLGQTFIPAQSTQVFPRDLNELTLEIRERREPMVRPLRALVANLPVNAAALELFWERNPQFVRNAPKQLEPAIYVPTLDHVVEFSIKSASGLEWFTECSVTDSYGKPVRPTEFPESHRAALERELKSIDDLVKAGSPPIKTYQGGGGGTPF